MSDDVDLTGYFERIGFAGSIAPNLTTLEALHLLHPAAIPFENLDPLLGLPVRLDQKSLEQKLLYDRRGGYCFEHNLLFMRVLRELDYEVCGLAARVLWGHPEGAVRPINHMILAVDIGGSTYLADVGFSRMTLNGPLRMKADVEQETPLGSFRLVSREPELRLEARIGEDWKPLYSFENTERSAADYEAFSDFVAKDQYFRGNLMAALTEKDRRLALSDTLLSIHPRDGASERRILTSLEDMRETLSGLFGITLPPDDMLNPVLEKLLAKSRREETGAS
ncbi:MAG TPA: arylamine N-acetyltransferase [Devosiaceae bacterium]|jgi:N-hydroxyarylamine O-acetyltransferase